MTTKELIALLRRYEEVKDEEIPFQLSSEFIDEIIKRLEELETLVEILDTCYLEVVKAYTMLRPGEMKEEE